jgi:hypothetical protein
MNAHLCGRGLHVLDPSFKAPNGARCRECYLATQARYDRRRYHSTELKHRLKYMKTAMSSRRCEALKRRQQRMEAG